MADALIFHNLEENVPVSSTRTEAQLLSARQIVEETAAGIADGVLEPKLGMHCACCAYRSLCPAQEKRIPNRTVSAAKLN